MFTGIVQAVGLVVSVDAQGDGVRLVVDADSLPVHDVVLGDSVAVAGCCLTVVAQKDSMLSFDVSAETLRCTAGLDRQGEVNLELALRFGDRLGGHLVSGHVDGVGIVVSLIPVVDDPWGSQQLVVDAPAELARFIAAKGSITIDGVSLTVNTVDGARFAVNLIPHTLEVTTLKALAAGARVNLEIDLLARYVARLQEARAVT